MRWLHFILSHSIFIAICAAALTWQSFLLAHHDMDSDYLLFVFIATLSAYNLYWLWSKYWHSYRQSAALLFQKEALKLCLVAVGLIVSAGIAWQIGISIPLLSLAVVCFLAYSTNLLTFLVGVKYVKLTKPFFLAACWAILTSYIPLQACCTNQSVLLIALFHFLFVLLLCFIFDKRDAEKDKLLGLPTIMGLWSKSAIILTITLLVLLKILMLLLLYFNSPKPIILLGPALGSILSVILWQKSNKNQHYVFYYFFVDGTMLFSALCTLLLDNL